VGWKPPLPPAARAAPPQPLAAPFQMLQYVWCMSSVLLVAPAVLPRKSWVVKSGNVVRAPSVAEHAGGLAVAYEWSPSGATRASLQELRLTHLDKDGSVIKTVTVVKADGQSVPLAPVVYSAAACLVIFWTSSSASLAGSFERRGRIQVIKLDIDFAPIGKSITLLSEDAYLTRGGVFPVLPMPGNRTGWGLPLRTFHDKNEENGCQAGVLLTRGRTMDLHAAAWSMHGCFKGRFGATLTSPHIVQGYTCAEYAVTTLLSESTDTRLWLSTPIDDADQTWNTAVPTGFPQLANSSFATLALPAENITTTPTMVLALNPPDGANYLMVLAGRGFAALKPLVLVEGPGSATPTTGASFTEPSLARGWNNSVVWLVYIVGDSAGHSVGIRLAALTVHAPAGH
jgi:hypothetical protein